MTGGGRVTQRVAAVFSGTTKRRRLGRKELDIYRKGTFLFLVGKNVVISI